MKRKPVGYLIKFYFWSTVFFIEGLINLLRNKKQVQPILTVSTGVNLLDGDEAVLAPKPSQSEAMKNKAMLGLSAMPSNKKKKLVLGIITLIYLVLFGAVNTVYWVVVLIKLHPVLGMVLLYATYLLISYTICKMIYKYFKSGKYKMHSSIIINIWNEAKLKSEKKLQPQNI